MTVRRPALNLVAATIVLLLLVVPAMADASGQGGGPGHGMRGGTSLIDEISSTHPGPDVSPIPRGPFAGRSVKEIPAGRNDGGRRHGGPQGDPGPQRGNGRRSEPACPAPVPVARTGLEPSASASGASETGGAGRSRKDPPSLPVLFHSENEVLDPLFLFRFLLFLGYRRIRPGTVLEHPVREKLYAAIAADPGLDLAGCVSATGVHRETLRYHLCLLICAGKIAEETRNGSVRFFAHSAALTPVHRAVLHLHRNPSLAPLIDQIRETPGISRLELAKVLRIAGPSVTRQVQRLIDEQLVESRRCGRFQHYWLTPECAGVFATIEAAGSARDPMMSPVDRASA